MAVLDFAAGFESGSFPGAAEAGFSDSIAFFRDSDG